MVLLKWWKISRSLIDRPPALLSSSWLQIVFRIGKSNRSFQRKTDKKNSPTDKDEKNAVRTGVVLKNTARAQLIALLLLRLRGTGWKITLSFYCSALFKTVPAYLVRQKSRANLIPQSTTVLELSTKIFESFLPFDLNCLNRKLLHWTRQERPLVTACSPVTNRFKPLLSQ